MLPSTLIRRGRDSSPIVQAILDVVGEIPTTVEPSSDQPLARARVIARTTAIKVAGISGALSLPPGPLGMATVVPDLLAIWKLQQTMVADIAAAFGKTVFLRREAMIYCLFKHGGAALMRDLVVRAGERYLIRRATLEVIQKALRKVGVGISQRVIGRTLSRWIPLVGAVGVGAYAYYDTAKVAETTIELFGTPLELEESSVAALVEEA